MDVRDDHMHLVVLGHSLQTVLLDMPMHSIIYTHGNHLWKYRKILTHHSYIFRLNKKTIFYTINEHLQCRQAESTL